MDIDEHLIVERIMMEHSRKCIVPYVGTHLPLFSSIELLPTQPCEGYHKFHKI